MTIYWVGLKSSQDWIRIDITRHIEVVPRLILRDIVSVENVSPNEATMKAVTHIADIDNRPISNTLEKHEQAMASSINMSPDMMGKGGREKGKASWMGKIWNAVRSTVAELLPMAGARFGPMGAAAGSVIGGMIKPNYQSDSYTGRVNAGLNVYNNRGLL